MSRETSLYKYQYIISIRLDPLDITEYLIYFILKYVTGSANYDRDHIVPELPKFSNNSCQIVTLGNNMYGVI